MDHNNLGLNRPSHQGLVAKGVVAKPSIYYKLFAVAGPPKTCHMPNVFDTLPYLNRVAAAPVVWLSVIYLKPRYA